MTTIEIHVPCKNSECLLSKTPEFNKDIESLKNDGINVSLILHEHNKKGLGELYNSILKDIRNAKKEIDYLFLMHSDVSFSLKEIVHRIIDVGDKYDLIGFAGTKKINLGRSPLTWFTGSHRFVEQRYGKITQNYLGRGLLVESFFNEKFPDTMDTEVACVDGLCLILTKTLIQSDILFDEKFKTDFYDLDFCLQTVISKKKKIGCVVVPVYHDSVGESVLTDKFLKIENDFRKKWGLRITER